MTRVRRGSAVNSGGVNSGGVNSGRLPVLWTNEPPPTADPQQVRPTMPQTITAQFDTRRAADLAVEHLVQEYGIARSDVFVESATDRNSAGSVRGGADKAAENPGTPARDDAPLRGAVMVSAEIEDGDADKVRQALRDQGAQEIGRA